MEQQETTEDSLSRRNFLKKVGVGTIGLGALSVAPAASQLKLTKNGIFQDNDQVTGSKVHSSTITATGGSQPAYDGTITGVTSSQTGDLKVSVYVDSDPGFNASYAFNYDYGLQWDDTNNQMDLNLTVNWDTDPTSGNDVTLRVEVEEV